MNVTVKLAQIICHQESDGRGDDEVAGLFAFEPVGEPWKDSDAMVVDADVDSDDGPEDVDLDLVERSITSEDITVLFHNSAEEGLRVRLAGLELDGVGSSESLARTQFEDFKSGPLPDTRHDRLWTADYVVSIQEVEDFLLEGDVPANPDVSDDELDGSSRWVKINDRTAHQHLVFTNEDQGSTYEVVLGYVLDYVAPDEDEPGFVPFFPLPFPFPFPFGRP